MKHIFFAPHNDDEVLFGCFTLIREKPLVVIVTDSYIQPNRGEVGCDAETRWQESVAACKILGCPVFRLGIRDDQLNEENLKDALKRFSGFDKVFAPAVQGGNWQHDLVGRIAKETFGNVVAYTTYTRTELWTKGSVELTPTPEELKLKEKALKCYQSQLNLPATRPHFLAVLNKSEFYE